MVTTEGDRLVADYLRELERELRDLPRARRTEIVEEIAGHIELARRGMDDEREVDVRNVLERLGDPAEIAAEAHERPDVPHPERPPAALEKIALILLLPGSLLVPFFGWIIGAFLLWMSDLWNGRDKLIGTLIVPGGLATAAAFAAGGIGPVETCDQLIDEHNRVVSETCTGGVAGVEQVLWLALLAVLVIGPFVSTFYLYRRLKRAREVSMVSASTRASG
jgi:uncharacterized membrane protein